VLNSLKALLNSRKALIAFSDFVFCLVLYFTAKYCIPSVADDIKYVIGLLQIPVGILIGAIAHEDAAAKRAGTFDH